MIHPQPTTEYSVPETDEGMRMALSRSACPSVFVWLGIRSLKELLRLLRRTRGSRLRQPQGRCNLHAMCG